MNTIKLRGFYMNIAQEMLKIALQLLNKRYGDMAGGVAVLRTDDGEFLTSTWIETHNAAVDVCAETGAICEAHKLNKTATHSLCICRENDGGAWKILTPCGVCQERLFWWGGDVKCAITNPENKVIFKKLSEIQPYYWRGE